MMSNNYKLHYKSDRCDKGPSSACREKIKDKSNSTEVVQNTVFDYPDRICCSSPS